MESDIGRDVLIYILFWCCIAMYAWDYKITQESEKAFKAYMREEERKLIQSIMDKLNSIERKG